MTLVNQFDDNDYHLEIVSIIVNDNDPQITGSFLILHIHTQIIKPMKLVGYTTGKATSENYGHRIVAIDVINLSQHLSSPCYASIHWVKMIPNDPKRFNRSLCPSPSAWASWWAGLHART